MLARTVGASDDRLAEARAWVWPALPQSVLRELFAPIQVGPIRLENRFVMSAMGTRFATADGHATDRQIAYYERRAVGGVAMVTVEGSSVHPSGSTYGPKLRLYDDSYRRDLTRIATAIKSGGAVPGIQLMHAGRHASPAARVGPALSPSGGESRLQRGGSKEMSAAEIEAVVESFAQSALRAIEAGFEAVEIHGAHGYLVHDFLSPLQNMRTDAWGGDRDHRARFLVEIVRAVQQAVGSYAAIVVRLSCSEFSEGGITIDDATRTAQLAAEAGANAILVSGGSVERLEWVVPPVFMPLAVYLDEARTIRAAVKVPVGVVGRLSTPEAVRQVVDGHAADLVFLGRALLADPDFPLKLKGRSAAPIRPCIACNECVAQHIRDEAILCTVNPAAGREREDAASRGRALEPRRILVVGAGPAGLLFAESAANRGHGVTLIDQATRTGGKLWLAAAAPYKSREMMALYASLNDAAIAAGVEFQLAAPEDLREAILSVQPDLVVIASGAVPDTGDDLVRHADAPFMLAEEYLALPDPTPLWPRVAIIGAGDTACDAAFRLAEGGSSVWLLARGNRVARGIEPVTNGMLRGRLNQLGVAVLYGVDVTHVGAAGLEYEDDQGVHELPVDLILYSRGVHPTGTTIASDIGSTGVEVMPVGDAFEAGNFLTSMRSAWELACAI